MQTTDGPGAVFPLRPVEALDTQGNECRAARILVRHRRDKEVPGIWVTTQRPEVGLGARRDLGVTATRAVECRAVTV